MERSVTFLTILIISCIHSLLQGATYYSKSSGNLNVLGTWGTNTDGSGSSPTNFTTANCTYVIVNNPAATIGSNWAVRGTNSKVVVGDGTQNITFTIPSSFRLTGTVSVTNNGTLKLLNTRTPTLSSLSVGSTVIYGSTTNQTVRDASYYNLILSGSGTKSLQNSGNTSVSNILTLNSGPSLKLNTNTAYTLTVSGAISGSGTIIGNNSANLSITGTGNIGPLTFSGTTILYNFYINRSGTISLGSDLTVKGTYTQTNGILDLSGNTLALSGGIVFPANSTNGTISGSSASSLSVTATSISNNLYMTTGAQTLDVFTLNSSGQTLTLGSDLAVSGTYTHTRGILNLNGHSLSLSGAASFPSSTTNGTTTGSSSSNLLVSASSITNRLYMTTGAETLNNFTLNSPAQTFTLGTILTVNGSFNHTNGVLAINGQTLTLNGAVTFPVSSTNGTLKGTTASDLAVNASSITNDLYFTTGSQTLKNFTMNSTGQTLTMGSALTLSGALTHTAGKIALNDQTLTLNGAITFPTSASNGSFTGSSASALSIGSSGTISNSMYMDQTSSATKSINNITLNRSGQTLTLGNALWLIGTLTPTAGTFASAGNLTLIASSASNVARIATIGTSASVTGNVTAQTYASGGNTGWALLGSAGITGRTFADWNDNFTITCSSCPNGYYGFASINAYSETAGGTYDAAGRYIPITSISASMNVGQGYWVYLGNGNTASTDIIFDVAGPVNQGNYTLSLSYTPTGGTGTADYGYNLIANPYPSPISWSSLRAGNTRVSNAIYVYNADLSAYASYVNGVSSPAVGSGGIGNLIPAGQGFYVKASSATTLVAKESYKSASTQVLLREADPSSTQTTSSGQSIIRLQASGNAMQNETAIYFDANANPYYETEYDAASLGVDYGYLGIVSCLHDTNYAINGLPPFNQNLSLPVKVTTGTSGTYQIAATDLSGIPPGACVVLHDNYTNTDYDLRSGPYSCTIKDTETVARFVLNIGISNNISINSAYQAPSCPDSQDGYLIADGGSGIYNYYWKDSSGTIIKSDLNITGPDTLFNIGIGQYGVDLGSTGTCNSGTQSFNIQVINSLSSSFAASTYSTTLNPDTAFVSFSNNSNGANTYLWDFGNGTTSISVNPSYSYTQPGTYTVTLYTYNSCGDTATSYQVIVVDTTAANTTGIQSLVNNKGMQISRDKQGYYVQFNYTQKTNALISVYDLLGEKAIPDIKQDNVQVQKTYIPLGNNPGNVFIINAVNSSGDKIFQKIVVQ